MQLLFNEDPLVGARIIAALDNWWNLLLEECESSDSPAQCASYFSTDDVISQIESGSFHCSLPKDLNVKREREQGDGDKNPKGPKKVKKENSTVVHNQCMIVDSWKLSKEEEASFAKIFNYNALLSRPNHGSGCKLCHKWALKRYCFSDCNNKASHMEWNTSDRSNFDAFQRKARGL